MNHTLKILLMTELYKWKKKVTQGFIILLVAFPRSWSCHSPGFTSQFGFLVFHKMKRELITSKNKQGKQRIWPSMEKKKNSCHLFHLILFAVKSGAVWDTCKPRCSDHESRAGGDQEWELVITVTTQEGSLGKNKSEASCLALNTLFGWACRKHHSAHCKTACGNWKWGTVFVIGSGFAAVKTQVLFFE